MRAIINGKELTLGTCYYPEHWDRNLWEKDLKRMLDNKIQTVRIAEFAWSKIEPREGEYNYEFFDSFLEAAEKNYMKVIFCTPTATPPAWLTEKYKEVLNTTIDGHRYEHGARRHYNYNSKKYLELCGNIVEKIASHYAGHKAIIGWQIDNEINCQVDTFYSESDTVSFRNFLKDKYTTIEELNKAWGTVFWNQTYTKWEEIYVPRKVVDNAVNPHMMLDYIRFISDSAYKFVKMQKEIIEKYKKKDDFITTNGIFSHLDNHQLTNDNLDFITYDSYPNFAYSINGYQISDPLKDRRWSKHLSEVRSISPIFGIMEQQSGANGWNTSIGAPTPRKGQITLWTMQSIAHGADFISYFRWRTCTVGTEMYWHGILDYSGRENKRLLEIKDIYQKLDTMQEIAGSRYQAKVAVLKDYDNIWDAEIDGWHNHVERVSQEGIFQAAQFTHTPIDYIYLDHTKDAKSLQNYTVIFYPHASILTEERMRLLEHYVENGGILIMGCRTGYKDKNGKCIMDYLPGLAANLTGTDVKEYTLTPPESNPVLVEWEEDVLEAAAFNDSLDTGLNTAKVVGTYINGSYKGSPALIKNRFGKGDVYYFGGAFSVNTAELFLKKLDVKTPYKEWLTLPLCCELAVRGNKTSQYLFLLNYSAEPADVQLHKEVFDLWQNCMVNKEIILPPYGCTILKITR